MTNDARDRVGSVQTSVKYMSVTKPGLSRIESEPLDFSKAASSEARQPNVESTHTREQTPSNNVIADPSIPASRHIQQYAEQVQSVRIVSEHVSDDLSDSDLLASVEAPDNPAQDEGTESNLPYSYGSCDGEVNVPKGSTYQDYAHASTPAGQPPEEGFKLSKLRYDPDVGLIPSDSDIVGLESCGVCELTQGQTSDDAGDRTPRHSLPSEIDDYRSNADDADLMNLTCGVTTDTQEERNSDTKEIQNDYGQVTLFSDESSRNYEEDEGREHDSTLKDEQAVHDLDLFNELVDLSVFDDEDAGPKLHSANEEAVAPNEMRQQVEDGELLASLIKPVQEQPLHHAAQGEPGVDGQAVEKLPIVRPSFPAAAQDRSPVIGLAPSKVLRTCFRIGEALNVGTTALRLGHNAVIELYAYVTSSAREWEAGRQTFELRGHLSPRPTTILEGFLRRLERVRPVRV